MIDTRVERAAAVHPGRQKRSLMRLMRMNRRLRALLAALATLSMLIAVWIVGHRLAPTAMTTDLTERNLAPSWAHPFGTDWLGRDMFARTLAGLTLSIRVGIFAATTGGAIALVLGLAAAALGKAADRTVTWLIDLSLSLPHLVTLILIAFVSGGGMRGVVLGVALTHWPSLTRVIRAELWQLSTAEFALVSRRLGRSGWWIASRHFLPHLLPQFFVGWLLLFPHAIMHESALTFLGLGLSPHEPAMGIILSESMRYLSTGRWWLTVLPGLSLLVVVRAFDRLGQHVSTILDPRRAQS